MSAPVSNINSFHLATKMGFHRLFQYIEGANLNWTYIPMTKPVMTSVLPGADGPHNSLAYVVHFYLPAKLQEMPHCRATVLLLGSSLDSPGTITL